MKDFVVKIAKLYRPFKHAVLVLCILIACDQILTLAFQYVLGKIIDAVIHKKSLEALACTAFSIYIVQKVILDYYREKTVINKFDFEVQGYTSKKTLEKILDWSMGQHLHKNSAITQSIINRGEHSLKTLAGMTIYKFFPLVPQISFTLIGLLYLNLTLGLVVFFSVALFTYVTYRENNKLEPDSKILQERITENNKVHTELLRNILVVQGHAQEHQAIEEYDQSYKVAADFGKKMWGQYAFFTSSRSLIIGIAIFAIIEIGGYYVNQGYYTPGCLVVFLTWSRSMFNHAGSIGSLHRGWMEMYSAAQKYFTLIEIEPAVKVIKNPVRPEKYKGQIEFKGVSFAYPATDDTQGEDGKFSALHRVNFIIQPGERVAFVGHSGAGKSTIARLLVRAYDPDQGQITIDGNDLRILDLAHFRKQIGVVEQDISLFDDTLEKNICFGLNGKRSCITQEALDEIVRLACIDQFWHRLEQGYNTLIGERGIRLSGGERQRVGIARALIKNPCILILDEATSHLDTENERAIQRAIESVPVGRTTIIIAHRLSTVQNADRIFVLEKGQIVGNGRHETLIETCEAYRRLIHDQTIRV